MTDDSDNRYEAGLFVTSFATSSRRTATVCEEVDSVWLYLSQPDTLRPDTVCWLLNTPAAPPFPSKEPYRAQNSPPPVPAELTLEGGVRPVPSSDRWAICWSEQGTSVVALLDNEPIGYITPGSHRGSARFIRANAKSWANPWDEVAFLSVFPEFHE